MGRDIRIIPDTGPESVIDFFRALYIDCLLYTSDAADEL